MRLWNIAFNNLRRRKGKVVFLVLGLLIGIATIVTLMAVTEAMTASIEERLDRFGANIVLVPRNDSLTLTYGGINVGGVSYQAKEFHEADLERIFRIPDKRNLGAVAPKVLGGAEVDGRTVLLMGVDFAVELPLKTWWQVQGNAPQSPDELLAGTTTAEVLGIQQGDRVAVNGQTHTVSGILAPTGGVEDEMLIGGLHASQSLLGKPGMISMVEIAAFCRDCPISEMVLQIGEQFPEGKVTAVQQAVMAKMQSIDLFRTFSYGIAMLVTLIGSLLVFVTMMGAVNERTREIGIFRAIGFRRGHIMHIILLEALVVGMLAGVAGTVLGNLTARLALPFLIEDAAYAGFNWSLAGGALLLSVALSLLASYYPARKGSAMDPSLALRAL